MICPKCKTEVTGAVVFCPECGANLMDTVSDTTEEIREDVKENAEAAFEETTENDDFLDEAVTDTREEIDSTATDVREEIAESEPEKTANVFVPVPEQTVVAAPLVVPAPVSHQAADKAAKKAAKKEKNKVAKEAVAEIPKEFKPFSTAGAFWYLLLAAIPVVGFIALLVFAFGGKNKNRKALSRAILLWMLIGLIITIAVSIVAYLLFGHLIEDFSDTGSLEEVIDIILDELSSRFD